MSQTRRDAEVHEHLVRRMRELQGTGPGGPLFKSRRAALLRELRVEEFKTRDITSCGTVQSR